jgi:hypothetical protein
MKFIPFLSFNHDHKFCSNQDHKKKHHAQEHKNYPGKPFSTREENPTKFVSIFLKRNTFTTKINPSTQELSWETLLNKGRKPSQICFYIPQEKYLHHQDKP